MADLHRPQLQDAMRQAVRKLEASDDTGAIFLSEGVCYACLMEAAHDEGVMAQEGRFGAFCLGVLTLAIAANTYGDGA